MKIIGVIPSRYASTRFPGKPLALIDGKSMIRRVYEQCQECRDINRIIIATDSKAIQTHVAGFGGEVLMTSDQHNSGTERCAEVLRKIRSERTYVEPDAIINIQGDEPFIEPAQISEVIGAFRDPRVMIATLAKKISDVEDLVNPNVVKVVIGTDRHALYFSRSPIPYLRHYPVNEWPGYATFYKHVGIYGYRPEVLEKLVELPVSALESAESLEQLRWLEAGIPVRVEETDYETFAIDTPEDLSKITNRKPVKRP